MIRYDRGSWLLATALAALAGFVDAIGFLKLGGLFVSFMSGNSTRLAVGIATGSGGVALGAGLIAAFVIGVIAGSLVGTAAHRRAAPAVLALVTALLAGAALLGARANDELAVLVMAAAMGAANAVFRRDGEVSIGVTYMTGTLVKFGQRLAAALTGGRIWAWVPYLLLWSGLLAGAVAGAFAFAAIGMAALWIAAVAAAGLALVSAALPAALPPALP